MTESAGIQRGERLARRDDLEWIALDGEVVVHDRRHERLHLLNVSAAEAWALCDGTRTVADVVADIRRHYADAPASIESEALEILGRLRGADLLESRAV